MSNAARTREINETVRYTMWSVFRLATAYGVDGSRDGDAAELTDLLDKLGADDVVVRGLYELSGLRADAITAGMPTPSYAAPQTARPGTAATASRMRATRSR